MRKLVDMASLPKDASSSRDGMKLVTQSTKSPKATDRGSMPLIQQPSIKPGNASNSVESVAPNGKG
jgi:hypothetical protein